MKIQIASLCLCVAVLTACTSAAETISPDIINTAIAQTMAALPTSTDTPIISSVTPHPTDTPTITSTVTQTITPTETLPPTITFTPSPTLPNISPAQCVPKNTSREVGVVVGIIDGDTIDVRLENGGTYRVRYIGIDTPERGQPFFNIATNKNSELVAWETVTLVKDVSETDRYDRLLRYVFVENVFVNYQLVADGCAMAYTYPPDVSCSDTFLEAERAARNKKLCLWEPTSTPKPTSTRRPAASSTPTHPQQVVSTKPPKEAKPTKPPSGGGNCHPSYPDVCIPPPPPDLDCKDIPFRRFRVVGSDPHRFDGDHDGIGCES